MTAYAYVPLVIVGLALTIALPIVACEWHLRRPSGDGAAERRSSDEKVR